jgi:hypothetical protein
MGKGKQSNMLEPAATVLFCLLVFGACAGAPEPAPELAPPDWVIRRPAADDAYEYFVGTGTSAAGDKAEASEIAAGVIVGDIMRYIGVKVTAETTAVARGSLDSFEAEVTQVVKQTGGARLVGFEIAESWTDGSREPAVTIHLLARYNKTELLKEKRRLEDLFREQQEAISGPEREGQRLAAEGRLYEGAIQFITAAAAATKSGVDNADIKFKRNIDQAMEAIEGINLIKMNDNLVSQLGQTFDERFHLKVVTGGGAADPGVPNVALRVMYKELHAPSGKMRIKTAATKTDRTGEAEFEHPIPEFVGSGQLTLSLDLASYLETLEAAPGGWQEQIDGLAGLIVRKKVVYDFEVISQAGLIKTGVLIADYDEDGGFVGLQETSSAVGSELADFDLSMLELSESDVAGKSDRQIITLLKERYGEQVERLLVGSVQIQSYREDSGRIIAKASGTIQVIDVESGGTLLTVQKEKSGMGRDKDEAASRAYKDLGELLGETVKNSLK